MVEPTANVKPVFARYNGLITELVAACGDDPPRVKEIILAQPSPLRAAIIACGAAVILDTDRRWRLFAQLIEIAQELDLP